VFHAERAPRAAMTPTTVDRPRQRLLGGFARVVAAESVAIPTGVLTVMLLTRQLGPSGYGLLGLAVAFVGWAEWVVTASFTRATVKFVSEADDWRPLASRAVQLQLGASVIVALGFAALSEPMAALMHEPGLAPLLRLYAIDIPVVGLAMAHRDVLVGRGLYRERALASGCRWVARLALIAGLLALGLSIEGAILGGIGSSVVEFAICRWYVQPPIFTRSTVGAGPLLAYIAPLSVFAVGQRLFDKMDLLTFKALGATAAAAGIYTSMESFTATPALVTTFTPLLLSSLGDSIRTGDVVRARSNARRALGAMFMALPLISVAAGMSGELVHALYGDAFVSGAPLAGPMMVGAVAVAFISVVSTILVAGGRPGVTSWLAGLMLAGQFAGNLLVIPRFGAMGAAVVTSTVAVAGCLGGMFAVYRMWGIPPPWMPFVRSAGVSVVFYFVAIAWPISGPWAFAKFAAISAAITGVFWWSGDLPRSRRAVRSSPPLAHIPTEAEPR
jgi:O-antigen/teichoic acid export membrane protein